MAALELIMAAVLGTASCKLLEIQDLMSPALSPAALFAPVPLPDNQSSLAGMIRDSGGGDLHQALGTMLFHRSKMNEYLCHNYLADEILSNLHPLERRSGEPAMFTPKEAGQDQLLTDQGSSSYREWLEKSAQMKELYNKNEKQTDQAAYETGDVTGYAMVQNSKETGYHYPKPAEFTPPADWSAGGGGGGWKVDGGWGGGGGGWTGSGVENQGWFDSMGSGWEEQESGKGLALKDLFDLALTALAFLAFGIFVLNLIMTCFAKTPNMTVVMATTTAAPDGRSRETRELHVQSQLNELAYRVLTSVDKFLELQEGLEESDRCFQYVLCDNNKYSRALNDRNKLWLPVWSLGMSWMAKWHGGNSAMDHIRAAVLGLGGANCRTLYPHCSQSNSPKSVQRQKR